ncbi:MAG: hypothetical protein Q9175_007498 [Cornicularia normoerica]
MPSLSTERGRTRSRQQTSALAQSQTPSRTRSAPRRTISPRSRSRSRTPSRTPSAHSDRRNGVKNGSEHSRSLTRSASRSGSGGRAGRRYRDRSYTRSPSRASPLPKSSKIVVEKLTKNVNEGHLREIFGAYGSIRELDLPMNRQCQYFALSYGKLKLNVLVMTNRGTAYIIYTDTPDAEAAIAHMHEAQLDGAIINVSVVLPRRKFSRSPPPARRGAPPYDRFEARAPPPGSYPGGPPPPNYGPPGGRRYRSPPPPRRGSPSRRYGGRPAPRDRVETTGVVTVHHHREEEGEEGVLATPAFPAIAIGVVAGVEVDMDAGGVSVPVLRSMSKSPMVAFETSRFTRDGIPVARQSIPKSRSRIKENV